MAKQNKLYEIEFFKLLFTIAILVFHSKLITCADGNPNLLPKGYLAVEFFFMVSGYFMANSIESNKRKGLQPSPFQFVFKRGWRLMPALLFGFVLSFVLWNFFVEKKSLLGNLLALTYALPEITLTGYLGVNFNTYYYNGPTWYISSMLTIMFLLYPFVKKFREKFGCYIAPVLAVFCYSYLSHEFGSIAVLGSWKGLVIGASLRACGGLSLGTTVYYICEKAKKSDMQLNLGGKIVVQVIEVGLSIMLFMYMRFNQTAKYHYASDYMFVFVTFILLIIIFGKNADTNKVFGIKPLQWLYKLSLPIYINQRVVSHYLNKLHPEFTFGKTLAIYLIGTIALSIISIPICKGIEWVINTVPKALTKKKPE